MGYPPHVVRSWPYKDIVSLMAYDRINPFGAERDNWHMAVQSQLFCSAHTKKGRRPPAIGEFMYKDPTEKREQNKQSFVSFLRAKVH